MAVDNHLSGKTLRGISWSAVEIILRYGITFLVGIILARLLTPDQYGLIGVLTIFIEIFNIIIDGGFSNALIRKKDANDIDFNTVFIINMLLSVMMAMILFLSAKGIARFFGRDELIALTRAMSMVIVINALAVVQKVRLTKQIDFKTQAKVTIISGIASGVIGIVTALLGMGVWVLVCQQISNASLSTLFLWFYSKWIPHLQFSVRSFCELWSFGWKLLASGLLNTISNQSHHMIIAKIYSPSSLGQYTRAHQFGNILAGNLTTIVQRVVFPVLSEIQDDSFRLKNAYRRIIKLTVYPTFVLMLGLCACSKSLLYVLIGPQWMDASNYLQILCFSLMIYPLDSLNANAIQVTGRSDITLKINLIKNILMIGPILIGLYTNILWMLVADVVREYLSYFLYAHYTSKLINYGLGEQIKDVLPAFIVAFTVAFCMYPISCFRASEFIILIIQIVIGFMLTIGISEWIKLPEYIELKGILYGLYHKITKQINKSIAT